MTQIPEDEEDFKSGLWVDNIDDACLHMGSHFLWLMLPFELTITDRYPNAFKKSKGNWRSFTYIPRSLL